MSYASIAQFQARYDLRVIAQLSNDSNGGTNNTANIQAVLDDGAGEILTAALMGSIYQASDLTALATANDPALIRLNCDVSLRFLFQRRAMGVPDNLKAQVEASGKMLDMIRKGTRVFNVPGNRTADVPAMVNLSDQEALNIGRLTATDFFGGPYGTPTTNG